MIKIILIDDDPLITDPLARALKQQGYEVLVAHDGQAGVDLFLAEQPNLVVLDILMPVMDGWAVCRRLREESVVPILMLTALDEEIDRILGLELGADDYLTKPFSTRELIARIKAMLRRVQFDQTTPPAKTLTLGAITVDIEARQALKSGVPLELRYKEFELLSLLLGKSGQVISRADILDQVWGIDWLGDTRTLDVHVRWLREKIEDDPSQPRYVQTVRGVGYRFATAETL
ncbi:MAG: response regulator transcription factor [Chloroflexota bacterium]